MDTPILRAGVALALVTLGCNGGPTDPNGLDDGPLRVRPVLETAIGPERLDLDAIGVTIIAIRDGSVASDTVLSYTGDPETVLGWVLDLELPARVLVEAEAWSGATRMFAGSLEAEVEDASPSGPLTVHDLDMAFVGPGAEAVEIQVTPAEPLLTFGDTVRFAVTGRDANGQVVDDVLAFWSSSDPGLAPISPEALLEAPHERASVRVEAVTPKGLSDDTGVAFQPSTSTLVVVRGDGASGPVRSSVPLEVRVVGADGGGVAGVDVSFAADEGAGVADGLVVSGVTGSASTMATLGPVAGEYTFTASASGAAPVSMVVTALPGPAEPGSATITASPTNLEPDGTATSTLTVRLFDAHGNAVTESGGVVVLATTLGDLTSVMDHGDGTYTAYLSSAEAGTATVTGTLEGEPIDDTAVVTFTESGGPSGPVVAFATIEAAPTEVPADNDTQSTLTVRLYDENEGPFGESGGVVLLVTSLGDLTAVTDNGDGTYTAYMSSAEAGTATVTGTLEGEPIDDTATVTFTDTGGPSGPVVAFATIEAAPTEVPADNDTQSTLTVRLYDENEGPFGESGGVVLLVTSLGDLTAVTDNGDGTYTAYMSSAEAGTATVTGTLEGEPIDDTATVTFTDTGGPSGPVIASIEVTPTTTTLTALGATQVYSAVARDEGGQPIEGVTFAWSVDDETVATIDPATGLATAVGNGSTIVTATAEDVTGTATLTVEQTVASLTLDRTCVVVEPCEPLPSFGDQVQIVAEALDANGYVVANTTVAWSSGDPAVGAIDGTGLVTAVGNGATMILASADGVSATIEVTVHQKTHAVTVEPSDFALGVAAGAGDGDPATGPARAVAVVPSEQQLTGTAYDANGNVIDDASFIWESLDPSVATVDGSGLVSALAPGTTQIRVTSEGVSADATVTVE